MSSGSFADHTEPLVDATGQLILASSKKDLSTLSSACQQIQHHLSCIVRIGTEYAVAQDDPSFEEELAQKVNNVSDRLEKLIPCFALFLQDTTNSIEKATDYANMAKNLGLAISELIVCADYSGCQKLLFLAQEGKKVSNTMGKCLSRSPFTTDHLKTPCLDLLQNEKRIGLTLDAFFRHAATVERRQQVSARAEDLRSHTTKFVKYIQSVLKREQPARPNQIDEMIEMNETLYRRLCRLEETLKAHDGFSSHLNFLYEQAIRLLKSARDLKLSGQRLLEVAREAAVDSNEFVAAARATALAAKKLADAAERTLENVSDPGRRYQIQQAIKSVLDASSKLIQDARMLASDPTNPQLAKILEESYASLDEAIQDLLLVADMDEEHNLLGKIHFSTKYAHGLGEMLDDPQTAIKNAEMIRNLTNNVIEDARRHAKTLPPAQRAEVERNCDNLEKLVEHLVGAAARYSATGSDEDRMKLDQVRELFQRGLQSFRKVVGLAGDLEVRPAIHIELTPPVPESVIKGRQEAEDCLEIVNFAREMVQAHSHSEKRDKIERGAELLAKLAGQLKDACNEAEENPFEESYLERVEELRALVQKNGAAILEHATSLSEEEIPLEELPPEEKKAIETVQTMEEIIGSLEDMLLNLDNLEGAEFLQTAKLISAKVKQVTAVLAQFAQKAEGEDKKRLMNLSKILNDESVQAKILASVVAAEKNSPGEQDSAPGDSFKCCAKNLVGDLHLAKGQMESTAIRSTASVRKERMQKMLELLKNQRGLK